MDFRALQRAIRWNPSSGVRRLVLLAPKGADIPDRFQEVRSSPLAHGELLEDMQRFRGRVYIEDGALREQDLIDGRHWSQVDDYSWHLLVLDPQDRVCACTRYLPHDESSDFCNLTVSRASIAACPSWGEKIKAAVESEMDVANRLGVRFVEVGGLALAKALRGSSEAIRMALSVYSLGQQLGGAVGVSTVTRRHCASSILRRIGGQPLDHAGLCIPEYFDPQYQCQMEILRFYSWFPNPRYQVWVNEIAKRLLQVPLIRPDVPEEARTANLPGPSDVRSFPKYEIWAVCIYCLNSRHSARAG